jgi:hypothetical protein
MSAYNHAESFGYTECSAPIGGIKKIIVLKASDTKIKDGKVTLKRKYGKFKREVKVYKNK